MYFNINDDVNCKIIIQKLSTFKNLGILKYFKSKILKTDFIIFLDRMVNSFFHLNLSTRCKSLKKPEPLYQKKVTNC